MMATVTRRLGCPPAAVLDVLADGWTYAAWVVGAARIRSVDPAWPAPGARIEHSVGLWPLLLDDVTIVREWRPGSGIELRARGWPFGEAHVGIAVQPRDGGGCVVRMTEDAVRGPGASLPRALRSAVIRPRNAETLRRLGLLASGRR